MAVILSIETSTSVCSAALHNNGELISAKEIHTPHSAASQLAVQIAELFSDNSIEKQQVNAVAVSSGPGSYTGLRIGAATAKGLCFGWNVPLIAIDSLTILSLAVHGVHPSSRLCPMIDARRMEVYCCLQNSALNLISPIEARVIDFESFSVELGAGPIFFFGDGSGKCKQLITHPNAHFIENIFPSAANMGKKAAQMFEAGEFVDVASFEPFYLKEFAAKTKSA